MAIVSVIVPVYKVEDYLDECVESIVRQTFKNTEIILVDDGSPDKCPLLCDEWSKKDDRITVIHKVNGGLSDARNAGLDIATGEFIFFVDSDDWIKEDTLDILYQNAVKQQADICACGIMNCSRNNEKSWNVPALCGKSEIILKNLYDDTKYPVVAWNKLYRRKLWTNIRFPVGKICEDAMTTYLLIDEADKIVQIADPLYCYRIREGSIMTSSFSIRRMDEEEAWRMNYEYMKIYYPNIWKSAYDFYLLKVNNLIHIIDSTQKNDYEKEYKYLLDILTQNTGYLLWGSHLKIKQRIKTLIDILKLI